MTLENQVTILLTGLIVNSMNTRGPALQGDLDGADRLCRGPHFPVAGAGTACIDYIVSIITDTIPHHSSNSDNASVWIPKVNPPSQCWPPLTGRSNAIRPSCR